MSEPIVALVTDLIFSTKIASTGATFGAPVRITRNLDDFRTAINEADTKLAIIDMNASGMDPLDAIRIARESPRAPHTIAYLSHVQTDLAESARANGVDEVMPRSEFSARLPAILQSVSHSE